ncbi:hypothetical protein JCM10450v2_001253 [Rhodotorula kratochvilovae]
MLTQEDVVRLLSKPEPIPQHVAFSILHAWVYSKSRRGNLPSETLSKLLSIQRKLQTKQGRVLPAGGPIASALDAMKTQLLVVNRKWVAQGAQAFGALGTVGMTGGHVDAIWAWTKATDGKIKSFPDGSNAAMRYYGEMDAGRVVEPTFVDSADPLAGDALTLGVAAPPPLYDGPPGEPDQDVVQALDDRRLEDETGVAAEGRGPSWRDSVDEGRTSTSPPPQNSIEEGAAHLARLRRLKEEQESRASSTPSPALGTA